MIVRYGYYLAHEGRCVGDPEMAALGQKAYEALGINDAQRMNTGSAWVDDDGKLTVRVTAHDLFSAVPKVHAIDCDMDDDCDGTKCGAW